MGPLNGIKVLEIAGIGPGPFAAMMLADMGANIIRIERPGGFSPFPDAKFDVMQRGRRSVILDIKKPEGVAAVLELAERADALIEGFRPGVMERLGLGPEACLARNPRLVYGRLTGKPAVCLGTLGPGATNLVTGIATAQLDSVPMVALTGNVPGALLGKDAFQEIDISGITLPMTKHNYLVRSADEIPRVIAEAFHIARTGRPGPVHVDFTKDALTAETTAQNPTELNLPGFKPRFDGHPRQVKLAAKAIAEAERLGERTMDAWLRFAAEQDRLSGRDVRDIRIDPDGTNGWGIAGARGSWDLRGGWNVTLAVDNVFDKRYRVHGSGLDAPGRNLIIGARKTW